MCVAQYRDITNAMKVKHFNSDQEFLDFKNKKNIEICIPLVTPGEPFEGLRVVYNNNTDSIFRSCFYYNLSELKKLAKQNNPYAIKHLENLI